jgi:hypothetical protein
MITVKRRPPQVAIVIPASKHFYQVIRRADGGNGDYENINIYNLCINELST